MKFLKVIQSKLSISLSDEKTVGIILHLSFVIGRLKNGDTLTEYQNKEKYISENVNLYNTIKESFLFINSKYKIELSDDELCYIMNFLANA